MCARWLRPATTQASWNSVVGLGQSSPIALNSRRQKKPAPYVLQYDMCSKHVSLSELTRLPVKSSTVSRSRTAEKRGTSVTSPHQSGSQPAWIHMVLVAAASLSRQISESKIYLTVQESCRSPSSSLKSLLLCQTIRGFGNHCLWFR